MEDDYGSNVHAGLEKSVRFRVSALERFCYKGFLRNSSGTKFFVRLREVSALGRFHYIKLSSCSDLLQPLWIMSKNGQTHFRNLAANLKCAGPFWDTMY